MAEKKMSIAKQLALHLSLVQAAIEAALADKVTGKPLAKIFTPAMVKTTKDLLASTSFKELKSPEERIAEITAEINALMPTLASDPEAATKLANASRRMVAAQAAKAALAPAPPAKV